MTYEDFRDWFKAFDTTLGGKPPTLPQWWELKARLDVVAAGDVVLPSGRPAAPASTPPESPPAPRADLEVEDLPPSELTVYEEAVTLLRKARR